MGQPPHERRGLVIAIAVMKLLKALALIAAGLAAVHLLGGGDQLLAWARTDSGGPQVQRAIARVGLLTETQLKGIAFGTFAYAALFLVEGVGLLLRQKWAEWLTVIVTASFLPFEIWHLAREVRPSGVATLVINLLVLVYLGVRIYRRRRSSRGEDKRRQRASASMSPA